jgi:hypothetical protein
MLCLVLADGPPGAAELLSPLLLEFRFRFGIVSGLILGLVGRL